MNRETADDMAWILMWVSVFCSVAVQFCPLEWCGAFCWMATAAFAAIVLMRLAVALGWRTILKWGTDAVILAGIGYVIWRDIA